MNAGGSGRDHALSLITRSGEMGPGSRGPPSVRAGRYLLIKSRCFPPLSLDFFFFVSVRIV